MHLLHIFHNKDWGIIDCHRLEARRVVHIGIHVVERTPLRFLDIIYFATNLKDMNRLTNALYYEAMYDRNIEKDSVVSLKQLEMCL